MQQSNHTHIFRFITAGNVDDGKSTLIGRLLYDSKAIYKDQVESVENFSKAKGKALDLTYFTDGLKEERNLGITIDIAYRFFTSSRRKFILADCPGHIPYTKNMITAASTANAVVILIDIRKGLQEQTKRHLFLCNLLRVGNFIICINKIDLVDFREDLYENIILECQNFIKHFEIRNVIFIPISALNGDNVIEPSSSTNWYRGETLLSNLEGLPFKNPSDQSETVFPVQNVISTVYKGKNFIGYTGKLRSGVLKIGDQIKVLPHNYISTIKTISNPNKKVGQISAPLSATITLLDSLSIKRGDIIVNINNNSQINEYLNVTLCWMSDKNLDLSKEYILLHCNGSYHCYVSELIYKINIQTLVKDSNTDHFKINEIGDVRLKCSEPIIFESYRLDKSLGSLILVDIETNSTVAAGIIKNN